MSADMSQHAFQFGPMQRDDSHEASCSCGEWGGSFDYQEDAEEEWRRHVERVALRAEDDARFDAEMGLI